MRITYAIPAMMWLGLCQGFPAFAQERFTEDKVKPLVTLRGQHSRILDPRLVRVTTERAWQALWAEHEAGKSRPSKDDSTVVDVDFRRFMVLAVFQGEAMMCSGFQIDSITETKDRITLRLRALNFQVVLDGNAAKDFDRYATQAWGVFILPRSNKQLVVERDERITINGEPKWRKWKTISALSSANKP